MCFRAEPSRQSLILLLHQTGMRSAFSLSSAVSLIDRRKRNVGDQPPINQTSLPLILFSCITPRVKTVVFALKTLKCHLRQGSKALIRKCNHLTFVLICFGFQVPKQVYCGNQHLSSVWMRLSHGVLL